MADIITDHLNRREFLVRTSSAAAGLVGAAALGHGVAEAAEIRPQHAKVDLIVWSHDFPPRQTIDRKYIKAFERLYPWVTVKYSTFPSNFETKLLTAMASGTGPDMFNLFTAVADPIVLGNAVVPVDAQAIGY